MLGATAVVLFAFSFGFRAALLAAASFYLIAFGLLAAERAWWVAPALDSVSPAQEPGTATAVP